MMLADGPKGRPLLPSYDPFIAPLSRLRERRDYGAARLNPGTRSDKNISPGAFLATPRRLIPFPLHDDGSQILRYIRLVYFLLHAYIHV